MNANAPRVLGIDIGGTYTKIGLVDEQGQIFGLKKFETNTENGQLPHYLNWLVAEARALIHPSGVPVLGIGISILGWLNDERSNTFFCMNAPSLNGVNLRKRFEEEFHLPVLMNEDLVAHNLAEYRWGVGIGCGRFLALVLGTGVGASMMIDGKPLKFTGGCVGDTGHLILRQDGPDCSSGCRGCGEALIGTANIERLARERYGTVVPAFDVISRAKERSDPIAVEIMGEIGLYTGELLASRTPIFLPSRIAIMGGTAKAGEVLLDAVRARFDQLAGRYQRTCIQNSQGYYRGVEIGLGSIEGETGVMGSAVEFFLK